MNVLGCLAFSRISSISVHKHSRAFLCVLSLRLAAWIPQEITLIFLNVYRLLSVPLSNSPICHSLSLCPTLCLSCRLLGSTLCFFLHERCYCQVSVSLQDGWRDCMLNPMCVHVFSLCTVQLVSFMHYSPWRNRFVCFKGIVWCSGGRQLWYAGWILTTLRSDTV